MRKHALDAWLAQYDRADYAEQCQMIESALTGGDETAVLDDEALLTDLIDALGDAAADSAQFAYFTALTTRLLQEAPELAAAAAGEIWAWRIHHLLLADPAADVTPLIATLAPLAADFPEAIVATADRLAFAGQLSAQARLMRQAWPFLQAGEFESWELEQFAIQAMNVVLLDYAAAHDDVRAQDPALLALLDEFAEVDTEALAAHLVQISGQEVQQWRPDQFTISAANAAGGNLPEAVDVRLAALLREFYHYAVTAGLPRSRVALAYWPLSDYLISRLLEHGRRYRPKRRKKGRIQRRTTGISPLCPTKISLARTVATMLEQMMPQHYAAAALMSVLPTWLDFLADRGLIIPEQQAHAANELRDLLPELRAFWEDLDRDPALAASLDAWQDA